MEPALVTKEGRLVSRGVLQSKSTDTKRIVSIDLLRGFVIVLMALDHVRDYFHADYFYFNPEDMQQTNGAIFFTRWITHFCAPAFVFLSGMSAFLVGERKTKNQLAAFLFKRGLWLIFLEFVIINLGWSFNLSYPFFRLQVIWVLGLSMVVLAGIIYLPFRAILALGLVILLGHNLLDSIQVTGNSIADLLWGVLHQRRRFLIGDYIVATGYPFLPWFGIMLLGYCFGCFYKKGSITVTRRRKFLIIGASAVLLFILLRSNNWYGDMSPWSTQTNFVLTVCSFLNTSKYPPSLLYTLMTLGPVVLLLAVFERPLNRITKFFMVFGQVPLFFYILHLYLIHGLATIAVVLSGRPWTDMISTTNINAKDSPWLQGYGFALWQVYLIWMLVVVMLYPLCRWYGRYKASHKEKWWLSYM